MLAISAETRQGESVGCKIPLGLIIVESLTVVQLRVSGIIVNEIESWQSCVPSDNALGGARIVILVNRELTLYVRSFLYIRQRYGFSMRLWLESKHYARHSCAALTRVTSAVSVLLIRQ